MSILSLFKPRSDVLREKIIFTQKARISSLEHEIDELKHIVLSRDKDMKETRTNFERAKERLVDQIVSLSDKFADLHQQTLDVLHKNAEMKLLTTKPENSEVIQSKDVPLSRPRNRRKK